MAGKYAGLTNKNELVNNIEITRIDNTPLQYRQTVTNQNITSNETQRNNQSENAESLERIKNDVDAKRTEAYRIYTGLGNQLRIVREQIQNNPNPTQKQLEREQSLQSQLEQAESEFLDYQRQYEDLTRQIEGPQTIVQPPQLRENLLL